MLVVSAPYITPDVEAALVTWLGSGMGVDTRTRVPEDWRTVGEFIRVIRNGGPRRDVVVDEATYTLECWAGNRDRANELARIAAGWMLSIVGKTVREAFFSYSEILSGPSNSPDPATGAPRYLLTGRLVLSRGGTK